MILQALTEKDIDLINGFSYANMPINAKLEMLKASSLKIHNGNYFELVVAIENDNVVGVLNVCAHSKSVVSIAPEIKEDYRGKGYAKKALTLAFELVKKLGYKIAYAGIKEDNIASIKLHESLGFERVQNYLSSRGNKLEMFIKLL